MRALTVRQPWATAIIHHGKSPENRTRNIAGRYRGPLAIHAALAEDDAAYEEDVIRQICGEYDDGWLLMERFGTVGAFLGVVDLVDVHGPLERTDCCPSPWAEWGRWHLVLANPRPITPIPARGMLGLWTPEPAALEQLQAAAR